MTGTLDALWQLRECKEFYHAFVTGRHTLKFVKKDGKIFTAEGGDIDIISTQMMIDIIASNRESAEESDAYEEMYEQLIDYAHKKGGTVSFSAVEQKSRSGLHTPRHVADAVLKVADREYKESFNHWKEEKMKPQLIKMAYDELFGAASTPRERKEIKK
jgi:hypothetical protein